MATIKKFGLSIFFFTSIFLFPVNVFSASAPLYEPADGKAYFGYTFPTADNTNPLAGDVRPFSERYQDAVNMEFGGKSPSLFIIPSNWQTGAGVPVYFTATILPQINQYKAIYPNSIPIVTWKSSTGRGTTAPYTGITTQTVNSGSLDSYIRQYAQEVKAYGLPIFFRPISHEVNANWYLCCNPMGNTSLTKTDFINAWKHTVDIFRAEGVTNVSWVWNVVSFPAANALGWGRDPDLASYYPGDDYVDWIGVDHYDWGDVNNVNSNPLTPDIYLDPIYSFATSHAKPVMIPEFGRGIAGSLLTPSQQETWIGNMFNYFDSHSKLKAVLYFNFGITYTDTVGHTFLYNNQVSYQPNANVSDFRLLAESGANFRNQFSSRISNSKYTSTLTTPPQGPATYYVSQTGNDNNSGTSTQSPWQSLNKVNSINFQAGDQILFQGGQTFNGTLYLDASDTGTAANPIIISSYGTGRATINSGTSNGTWIYNTSGFKINNINFVGSGPTTNTGSGIQIRTDLPNNVKLPYVYIDNVEVSGYRDAGISISGGNGKSGYSDVRITNCVVRDNGNAGLEIFGVFNINSTAYAHSSVYIGYCKAYNNSGFAGTQYHSGNGIVIADIEGGTIEHSIAYNNGGNNTAVGGPIGIWAWDSNNLIIQYNESHNNKTNSTADGGGFDLDGGMTNSILQYNYAHDNEGPGFGFAQYTGARPFSNNTIRYNISQNDGKKNNTGGIGLWNGGSGISNSHIYNNTVFVTPTAGSPTPQGILFMTPTTNVSIRNNIFITSGAAKMIDVAGGQSNLLFQGNSYWSTTGNFSFRWNGTNYTSLSSWRTATGQEKIGVTNTGFDVNPLVTSLGGGTTLNDTTLLTTLTAYRLQSGSPLINQGLNLLTQFGINPGTRDFYGNTIPQGAGYDVGSHDSSGSGATFNFSLSSSLPTVKVMQAKSVTNSISATLTSGTAQTVSFTTSGLPSGATATYSPTTCSPTCTTTVTVNTSSTTPVGNSTITVTGTAGAVTKTTTFTLDMNYIGDINIDGIVNSLDWSLMNFKWNTNDASVDLNNDGSVNTVDFSLLNNNWFKSG